jgi:DNA-binding Lrp family transcriptional regulator
LDGITLDELDMKILNVLTRNSRVSYNTLGKEIGLTAKSVKARVKKMQSGGIFGNFIARVNPSVLGYSKFWLVYVKKSKGDEKHIQQSLRLLGDILYRAESLGNPLAFLLAIKEEAEEKFDLLVDALGQAFVEKQVISFPSVEEQPTYTDLRIIRCLLANPRMKISDIARKISMSSKTVARRLDKMIENRILEFSTEVNPVAMRGYIVSVVSAHIEKAPYVAIPESGFVKDAFFLYSPWHSQNMIYWLCCTKDVFVLDSVVKAMESYLAVRRVDISFPIHKEYYEEVVTKNIQRRLQKGEADSKLLVQQIERNRR